MDSQTLQVYEAQAAELCAAYRAAEPAAFYRVLHGFLHPGGRTADIGSGSGRDTAWLLAAGFAARGYDAAPAMLAQARAAYPQAEFAEAALPDLAGLDDASFDNVVCAATLMHVGRQDLISAVLALARVLRPGGRLALSYRAGQGADEREADGRLYTDLPPGRLTLLLEAAGLQVVDRLIQADVGRPQLEWTVILAEKGAAEVSRGLERVQSVLMQDRKSATYKYALIRALCAVSRTEPHAVRWGPAHVYVPLLSIGLHWLAYYWPLLTGEFCAQRWGERPGGEKPLTMRRVITSLAAAFGPGGLYALLGDMEERPHAYRPHLQAVAQAVQQPVRFAGTPKKGGSGESGDTRLFQFCPTCPGSDAAAGAEASYGWVAVPEAVWLDISRFSHWIEDSVVLRWAELSAEMNPERTAADFLPRLLQRPDAGRDTGEVRQLLLALDRRLDCVWSGNWLDRDFEVDHVIPHSVWGNNDWWNMLPSLPRLNNAKRDALPTRSLLQERKGCIIDYWRIYYAHVPERFGRQARRALGLTIGHTGWENVAFAGLQETVERLALTRGLGRWQPG